MLYQEIFCLCVFEVRGIFRAEAIVYVKGRKFLRNTDKSSHEITISRSIIPVRYARGVGGDGMHRGS
jgi:hypothetical protein